MFDNLTKGIFVRRPNRFIVLCTLNKRTVKAYLPNPGRLWELLFPGTVLYLAKHDAAHAGSTGFTVVAVEREGHPVMLHTHLNNHVAARLIQEGRVPGLEGCRIIKPEVGIGRSRFDFLLDQDGKNIIVEVKSCTLAGNRIAMFPDAITVRGTRHLRELAALAKEGNRAAVLFLVHWPRAEFFMPEWHTDLELARTLLAVKDLVLVKALSVEWGQGLELGWVRETAIPWGIIEKEAHDRGSYIMIVRLSRDRRLSIGTLGNITFRKGYYLYVGSATGNLSRQIGRHRRRRKNNFGHMDYLREAADFHAALPVRASDDLQCKMAAEIGAIADWRVDSFGSSGCRCSGHLFGMARDPVHSRSFMKLLQYFRMDRLERYLK